MRQLITIVIVSLVCGASLGGQRRIPQEKVPGRWGQNSLTFGLTNVGDGVPISAIDQKSLATAFEQVAAVIRAAPALNPVTGVEAMIVADPAPWLVERPYRGPLPVHARLGFFNLFQDCAPCPVQRAGEWSTAIDISINDPGVLVSFLDNDSREGMALGARRMGERHGMPLYHLLERRFLVLTRIPRPIFVPVTREEFLRRRIAETGSERTTVQDELKQTPDQEMARVRKEMEAAIAQMEKIDPKAAKQMREEAMKSLREVEAQLAAGAAGDRADRARAGQTMDERLASVRAELAELDRMPPDVRKSPAYAGATARVSNLSEESDEGALPVVRLNPQFFDRSLPAAATQLIVVGLPPDPEEVPEGTTDYTPYVVKLARRVVETLNWKSLLGQVKP